MHSPACKAARIGRATCRTLIGAGATRLYLIAAVPMRPGKGKALIGSRPLSQMRVAAAARFNALGLVAVLLLLWAFGAWTYGRLMGRRVRSWQHLRWSAPVALVLTLAWFVVRNLEFGPFVALHV